MRMLDAPQPPKRPLAPPRTDSLGTLPAHLAADLSLNSTGPSPAATPSPTPGTSTPVPRTSAANATTPGRIESSPGEHLGRGKRLKIKHEGFEDFVTGSVVAASRKKKSPKAKGKQKAVVDEEVGPGWWFERPDEAERRHNAFILSNTSTFLPVLPSHGPNYVSRLLASSSSTPPSVAHAYRAVPQPSSIAGGTAGILKDYQLKGLSWLAFMAENGANAILADEMGLGKTLQTLALIAYLAETHGHKGPHLLVCPLSVLTSWMTEIARWLPDFTAIRYHGPVGERIRLKSEFADTRPDLVVTTYEAFVAEASWFKSQRTWGVVALDEGHRIKNNESQAALALQGIKARMRLILTGTPLQNNLVELWALLHFLYPAVFPANTYKPFRDAFDLSNGLYDATFLNKAQKLLGDVVMLRRTKDGVAGELSVPPREELTLYVPLSPIQRFWYQRLLTRSDVNTLGELFGDEAAFSAAAHDHAQQQVLKAVGKKKGPAAARLARMQKALASAASGSGDDEQDNKVVDAKGGEVEYDGDGTEQAVAQVKKVIEEEKQNGASGSAYQKLMVLLMQLRKCCCHPYLLPNSEPDGELTVDEHVVAASAKLVALDKLLKDVLPKGERVLIFSGFTRMLDILEDHLNLRGYKYARLDGSTSRPRRALDIRLFQQEDSPLQVYLISTRAGGLGINLTAATTVVLHDQDFNPQVDIQAIARAHRIGQTKTVRVYRLVTQGSVEEQAMTRLRKKLYLSVKVMGGMRNATERMEGGDGDDGEAAAQNEDEVPRMTRSELISILRAGTGALAAKWDGAEADAFTSFRNATFSELCERGRQRDSDKDAEIKVELGEEVSEEERARLEREEEEAERALLDGREAIVARKFEGKTYAASNSDIRKEWEALVKRDSKERVVMIDGHAVAKDSISTKAWEAVPTITSDAKAAAALANPARKKRKFEHQDHCHACQDGGDVFLCTGCPRAYHAGVCAGGRRAAELARTPVWYCPQHTCAVCDRNTSAAGGLLFRCQTCPTALCEDCLPASGFTALGDELPELLLLGYGKRTQAYWIRCAGCLEHFAEHPDQYAVWRAEQDEVERKARKEGFVW
ncbi:hypothetical protein JCM3770_004290 [Rhodotorula araucariae]